jgi:hypothetical protein
VRLTLSFGRSLRRFGDVGVAHILLLSEAPTPVGDDRNRDRRLGRPAQSKLGGEAGVSSGIAGEGHAGDGFEAYVS